ncbi:Hpt domain-containing protein [Postechiella marina]|uniref:Hpt domain-containing protein n=1 Tax=Postechiella marina TaxID=943941 RepID=A0ABP8BZ94_9FLAO
MEQPNLSYIESMSGGDKSFEKKIIDIVKKEFPEEVKTYRENSNSDNFKLMAENVHKLKHKISILGLEKSYDTATAFENDLFDGDISLKEEFESILNLMQNYLNEL